MSGRRVVITGIEVLAPGGVGKDPFWDMLSEGRTATRGITFFDPSPFRSRVAAEMDFDPEQHGLAPQEVRRMDRAAQFAVVAARGAVADSGIDLAAHDPHRVGVTIGSAVGATTGLDEEYRIVSDGGRSCIWWTTSTPYRICTTTSSPAPSRPRSPGRSARRAPTPWCPRAAPPASTRSVTRSS